MAQQSHQSRAMTTSQNIDVLYACAVTVISDSYFTYL